MSELTPAAVVRTATQQCPVYVGWGWLPHLGALMQGRGLRGLAVIISDRQVDSLYGQAVAEAVAGAGFPALRYAIPPGESSKTLSFAAQVYDFLVAHRVERRDTIVALGGGVVGDLAGFVAATFLRGLPWVQVPTSLVAMTDASIGGKVAVNHPQGKNLIGAFYQPELVLADVSVLSTLPPRELTSGWAEVIKHALTLSPQLLDLLEREGEGLLSLAPEVTSSAIALSAAVKVGVVNKDERETTGLRTILNYGHTIGHGLEAASSYGRFLHGEAVAIGMNGAALLSQRLGLSTPQVVAQQKSLLERFGLPISCPGVDPEAVVKAIELDKKSQGQAVRWVLLNGIGSTTTRTVPGELVMAVLREITGWT